MVKRVLGEFREISRESFFRVQVKRFVSGFLVLLQAVAVGIVGLFIYYFFMFYSLWYAALLLILILVYLVGMYKMRRKRKGVGLR